uniref:5'-3' exonuclease domain-containing protein n=1 Tax=viral metagenome TaxID=1070528 RepID=A0A6C0C5Q6_9ZZZZ
MPNFLLIDGSYYCFYRYFATEQWFNLAKREENIEIPSQHELFINKFRKTFVDKIGETIKKLKIDSPIIIVGKDCPRRNIWRMKLFPGYKSNRNQDAGFMGGPFFKMAYDDNLFEKAGSKLRLSYPGLEADDCIAIATKHILEKYDDAKIWIIASDMDYLQLASDKVKIFNLKYQDITENKNCFKDSDKDLFCKIVAGDKSDCIPSVFKKCGIKTAEKFWNNKDNFNKKLEMDIDAKNQYILNKKIIDFNNIPKTLVSEFKEKYGLKP